MFVIHCLLSEVNRVSIVDNNSAKFGIAERGATPAKPKRTARMMGIPCNCAKVLLAADKSSFSDVRLTKVLCNTKDENFRFMRASETRETYQECAGRRQRVTLLQRERADGALDQPVEKFRW